MLPGKAGNEVKGVLISIWIIFRVWLEYYILPDTVIVIKHDRIFTPLRRPFFQSSHNNLFTIFASLYLMQQNLKWNYIFVLCLSHAQAE